MILILNYLIPLFSAVIGGLLTAISNYKITVRKNETDKSIALAKEKNEVIQKNKAERLTALEKIVAQYFSLFLIINDQTMNLLIFNSKSEIERNKMDKSIIPNEKQINEQLLKLEELSMLLKLKMLDFDKDEDELIKQTDSLKYDLAKSRPSDVPTVDKIIDQYRDYFKHKWEELDNSIKI
ncbi:hypothetical protein K3F51_05625 [Limosilactobacillus reuteri]|uniref:hypothetical protein n=1 Tax=Limosilactobacillus reuteri TaxID=1598 RepID=UPI001CBA8CEC|nr:hypothetical protein [Limosilactobacillus reuteri]UAW61382.1 hypothetical protein K3F51_05625 [Limosilactobacillus reuteri]